MTETTMTPASLSPKLRGEILASVKERVLKEHFNVGGVNYNEWAKRFDERSPTLLDVDIEEFEGGVRKALAELGSSHTFFYHERTIRLLPQHSINATIRAFERDGRESWHFLDVFEDGPAHLAASSRATCWSPSPGRCTHANDASIQNWYDAQDCRLERAG